MQEAAPLPSYQSYETAASPPAIVWPRAGCLHAAFGAKASATECGTASAPGSPSGQSLVGAGSNRAKFSRPSQPKTPTPLVSETFSQAPHRSYRPRQPGPLALPASQALSQTPPRHVEPSPLDCYPFSVSLPGSIVPTPLGDQPSGGHAPDPLVAAAANEPAVAGMVDDDTVNTCVQEFFARVQVPISKLLDTPATSRDAGAIQNCKTGEPPLRSRRLAAHKLAGVPVAKRGEILLKRRLAYEDPQVPAPTAAAMDYGRIYSNDLSAGHREAIAELFPPSSFFGLGMDATLAA
ncbi:hypothetical protein BS78_09G055100 [Paspalum vaginatum]|nr:hypothetical protein BS78_09G055100 [Paspalum vaginatum]